MIDGIFETHIIVSNLENSALFYEEILGLQCSFAVNRTRFYKVGNQLLGLWEQNQKVDTSNSPDTSQVIPQHFAFKVSINKMKEAFTLLKERGVPPRNFFNDGTDRLYVHAWNSTVSIYFSDPDGHVLELISQLSDEPKPELGMVPWEEWETMHGRTL